jgi:hypothetical protein
LVRLVLGGRDFSRLSMLVVVVGVVELR